MVVPFGFSGGDFVCAIGLVVKVGKALRDVDGASVEYQQLHLELQGLKRTLEIIQALQPKEDNIAHFDAIRCLALTCQIPLTAFLQRLQKFEQKLGPFAKHSAFGGPLRKSQWALEMGEEVQKLRATISAKVLGLTLLISVQNADTLSRVAAQTSKGFPKVFSKLESISVEQTRFSSSIANQTEKIQQVGDYQKKLHKSFNDNTQQIMSKLGEADGRNRSMSRAVTSLTHNWSRIIKTFSSLPQELRDILRRIAASNFEMYDMLRKIQDHLSRSPCPQAQDSIMFEDVLGRSKLLPYEYFQHFDMVDRFLRHQFEGLPGEDRIGKGAYVLLMQSGVSEIGPTQWTSTVFPGSKVQMSVLLDMVYSSRERCPKAGCPGSLGQISLDRWLCGICSFQIAPAYKALKAVSTARVDGVDDQAVTAGASRPLPEKVLVFPILHEVTKVDGDYFSRRSSLQEQQLDLQSFKRVHMQVLVCSYVNKRVHEKIAVYYVFNFQRVKRRAPNMTLGGWQIQITCLRNKVQ